MKFTKRRYEIREWATRHSQYCCRGLCNLFITRPYRVTFWPSIRWSWHSFLIWLMSCWNLFLTWLTLCLYLSFMILSSLSSLQQINCIKHAQNMILQRTFLWAVHLFAICLTTLSVSQAIYLWLCSLFVGRWQLFKFLNPIHSR
jgi:hypothetical protein